jgi:hypothetical protein
MNPNVKMGIIALVAVAAFLYALNKGYIPASLVGANTAAK